MAETDIDVVVGHDVPRIEQRSDRVELADWKSEASEAGNAPENMSSYNEKYFKEARLGCCV